MKRVGAKACAALLLLALCLAPLIQPAGIYHRMADLPQAKDPPPDSCYQSFNVGRWMVASASISRCSQPPQQPQQMHGCAATACAVGCAYVPQARSSPTHPPTHTHTQHLTPTPPFAGPGP